MTHRLAKQFEFNSTVLKMNCEGITQDESLVRPQSGGNPLNWIVGHIVASRNIVLELIGAERFWSKEKSAAYDRGAKPFSDPAAIISLEKLLAEFERSNELLTDAFTRITPDQLQSSLGNSTLEDYLYFLYFHEAYHLGQIGLLRRFLGKPGAIP